MDNGIPRYGLGYVYVQGSMKFKMDIGDQTSTNGYIIINPIICSRDLLLLGHL